MKKIGIIGLGRAGKALAYLLTRNGYIVMASPHRMEQDVAFIKDIRIAVRTKEKLGQEVEIIILATPDRVIAQVAEELAELPLSRVEAVLHLSGAMSPENLAPLRKKGKATGVLHPLQSLASLDLALENMPDTVFTYQGDASLQPVLEEMVCRLGGKLKMLPPQTEKVLYHAGAAIVSNYLVSLTQMGVECLQEAGFTCEEAKQALLPLMKGTLNNLRDLQPSQALTGPVSRGDAATVRNHVEEMKRSLPHLLPTYTELGKFTAELALAAGTLTPAHYAELQKIFTGGKKHG